MKRNKRNVRKSAFLPKLLSGSLAAVVAVSMVPAVALGQTSLSDLAATPEQSSPVLMDEAAVLQKTASFSAYDTQKTVDLQISGSEDAAFGAFQTWAYALVGWYTMTAEGGNAQLFANLNDAEQNANALSPDEKGHYRISAGATLYVRATAPSAGTVSVTLTMDAGYDVGSDVEGEDAIMVEKVTSRYTGPRIKLTEGKVLPSINLADINVSEGVQVTSAIWNVKGPQDVGFRTAAEGEVVSTDASYALVITFDAQDEYAFPSSGAPEVTLLDFGSNGIIPATASESTCIAGLTFAATKAPLLGDVNKSGVVNIIDAQITYDLANEQCRGGVMTELLALWGEGTIVDDIKEVADVTTDGFVEANDAFSIQYAIHHGGVFASKE